MGSILELSRKAYGILENVSKLHAKDTPTEDEEDLLKPLLSMTHLLKRMVRLEKKIQLLQMH